jgi:hypothetical protein
MLIEDLPRALSLIGDAERTMREVVRIDARPGWRRDLAVIVERGGALRLRAGDLPGARESAREALALIEQVAAEEPQNPHTIRAMCEVLLFAADTVTDDAAAKMYRSRVATLAAPARNDPRLTEFRVRALMALGRHAEAAPLVTELLAIGYRDGEIHRASGRSLSTSASPPGSPPAD